MRDRVERDAAQPGDLAVQPAASRASCSPSGSSSGTAWTRSTRSRSSSAATPCPTSSTSSTPSSACRARRRVVRGTRDFAAETKERQRALRSGAGALAPSWPTTRRAEADRLAAARAAKEALVADLRRQASLTSSRIDRLDQAAQEAATRAEAIQAEQAASAGGSPTADRRAPATATQAAPPPHRPRAGHARAGRDRRPADHRLRDGVLHPRHDRQRPADGVRRVRHGPGRHPHGNALLGARLRHLRGGRHGVGHHRQHHRRVVPRALEAQAWGRQSVTITILG